MGLRKTKLRRGRDSGTQRPGGEVHMYVAGKGSGGNLWPRLCSECDGNVLV